jgi:hypothetical protein
MKTYTVKITLQPDCGCVTGMVEIPGTFCRFLITSHADGSLCLWDLKRQKLFKVGVRRSRCARVGVWLCQCGTHDGAQNRGRESGGRSGG